MSLGSAAERVTTLERWRRLLSDAEDKSPAGSAAYAQLVHELESARVDAVMARAKEDARVRAVGT